MISQPLLLLLVCVLKTAVAIDGQDTLGTVRNLLSSQERTLRRSIHPFSPIPPPRLGVSRSARHTSLTSEIGHWSNENLAELGRLLSLGFEKSSIIGLLKERRHPFCKTLDGIVCNKTDTYRTIDGTCNNVLHPRWGSSFHKFQRLVPTQYPDGYNQPRGLTSLPNPRIISTTVHPDKGHPDPTLTNKVVDDHRHGIVQSRPLVVIGLFHDHEFALTIEGRRCCTTVKNHVDCMAIDIPVDGYFYDFTSNRMNRISHDPQLSVFQESSSTSTLPTWTHQWCMAQRTKDPSISENLLTVRSKTKSCRDGLLRDIICDNSVVVDCRCNSSVECFPTRKFGVCVSH